ncbi:MAG: transposase [Chloroflexi bacterium]|nr:transposase [Chloroflexota bacterium]
MGFGKRSGDSVEAILYTLFLLPLLQVRSIFSLFEKQLTTLLTGGKDVVYGFMENQSINWSLFTMKIAFKLCKRLKWDKTTETQTAFIVDDTLDQRYGKKVEATSLHWDHNKGVSIKGHQFLQLGLSYFGGFLPLIGHIFVGKKKRAKLSKEFDDRRKAVAKSYHDAHNLTKHDLLAKMLDKAISFGFHATYLLADAWFGCKKNVKLALKHDLIAIFMMKRGRNKYRYNDQLYTAKGLYRKFRKQMVKVNGKSFHACAITVEYNISEKQNSSEWIQVQLVFSRMKSAPKSSWVVILCTDIETVLPDILEVYALRWNIEVYFKEIKQYFGFGKEQSWQYAVILSSIHLAMIRYLLFYYLSIVHSSYGFSELRNQISLNLMIFSYGFIAWQSISEIISGILDNYSSLAGEIVMKMVKADIETQVGQFFENLFPITLGILPEEIQKLDYSEKKGAL